MPKTTFTDGDKSLGIPGTRLLAAFLNKIFGHRHDGQDQDGSAPLDYAVDSGVADAYAIALTPALTAHINGMPIRFKAANANTGAATLNIDGLGAVAIKKGGSYDIEAGAILAGAIVEVSYDGTYFQITNASKLAHNCVYNNTQRALNNAAGYQNIPNTSVTQVFTGKRLEISVAVQAKNTGSVAHELQVALNIDGTTGIAPFEAGPDAAGGGQWQFAAYTVDYAGLVGNKTIQLQCKVDGGAGCQETVYRTSINVHELP
ncbi:MAG: hypothetical protein HY890_02845 [Deltaproteobacteria bacterium]|nr:hypothetical protein [Deltaproteobacteria bacterium]